MKVVGVGDFNVVQNNGWFSTPCSFVVFGQLEERDGMGG